MAHDVFISYSSNDKSIADAVCSYLENSGIRCWIAPRDVSPGKKYAQDIMDAINESRVMVIIFSASANKSDHVSAEIERAMSKGIIIVPFRIEDVTPTGEMEYYLSGRHWLDALTAPMEQHIIKLVTSVGALLGKQPSGNGRASQKLHGVRHKPIRRNNRVRRLVLILAAVLVLLSAGALLYRTLFKPAGITAGDGSNTSDAPVTAEGGNKTADTLVTADVRQIEGASKQEAFSDPETIADQAAVSDQTDSSKQTTIADAGNVGAKNDAARDAGGKAEASDSERKPAAGIKAEITDSILTDGWSKFELKNSGEEGDFNVIVKGLDADGKLVSIKHVTLRNVPKGGTAEGTTILDGKPDKQEIRIVDNYEDGPVIQEQLLRDGWVNVILTNGGNPGGIDLVAKGYDTDGSLVSIRPIRIENVPAYGIQTGTTIFDSKPVTMELYILRDYGSGPKIQEQLLKDGWVTIMLANGGDEGSFKVRVKGYDDKGSAIDLKTVDFNKVPKNGISMGTTILDNRSVKMELSLE